VTDNDREDFAALILGLSEMLDRKPMSETALAIYWETLRKYDIASIRAAGRRHVEDPERGTWMPKTADLIRYLRPSARPPLMAWAEVEHAMMSVGAYRSVQFLDGTINAVIADMGGWPWLCRQNLDEPWTQREFERRYATYHSQRVELNRPLIGIHEDDNRRRGFLDACEPPTLVGDGIAAHLIPEHVDEF